MGLVLAWVSVALIDKGPAHARPWLCAAAAVVVTLVAMHRAELYRSHVCALPSRETARILACTLIGGLVFAACDATSGPAGVGAPVAGLALAAALILVLRWRFDRWLQGKRATGQYLRTAVLVGTNDDAVELWDMLAEEPELGYRIAGVVGEERQSAPWQAVPHSAEFERIVDLARRTNANGVIVVAGSLPAQKTSAVVAEALGAGLHVQIWPGFMGLSSRRLQFAPVSGSRSSMSNRRASPGGST